MVAGHSGPKASLDLTHVLYDDGSYSSLALALVTLSPILLMASYAALAVQTREVLIINMWAGQLACEGFNWLLKRCIKQGRPAYSLGTGYGFPSSHSQYMGYFTSFLIFHLMYRHRFERTGYRMVDVAWRLLLYTGLVSWAGAVAYSRYSLEYHTAHQILWGLGIGIFLGASWYYVSEVYARHAAHSVAGRLRRWEVANDVSAWLGVRDGWAVWADGGRAEEWRRWKGEWDEIESKRKRE